MELERQSDSYCKQISFHVDWEANHLHISAYHSFLFPTNHAACNTYKTVRRAQKLNSNHYYFLEL